MDLVELNRCGENYNRHPWELARAEIAINKIREMEIPVGTTILDIGCGDTYFIKQLSSVFPENKMIGVDIAFTKEVLTELSNDLPTNVSIVSKLNEINFEEHTVSLVLLMDVIEHVPDDKVFLKEIFSNIKKGHNNEIKFLITVPAFQWLYSAHDIFLGHYRRYTVSLLTKTLLSVGLDISKKGYFFTSLYFARMIMKILERLKFKNKNANGIAAYYGSKTKTNLIKRALLLDYKINRIFKFKLPGLSCYAICSKQI